MQFCILVNPIHDANWLPRLSFYWYRELPSKRLLKLCSFVKILYTHHSTRTREEFLNALPMSHLGQYKLFTASLSGNIPKNLTKTARFLQMCKTKLIAYLVGQIFILLKYIERMPNVLNASYWELLGDVVLYVLKQLVIAERSEFWCIKNFLSCFLWLQKRTSDGHCVNMPELDHVNPLKEQYVLNTHRTHVSFKEMRRDTKVDTNHRNVVNCAAIRLAWNYSYNRNSGYVPCSTFETFLQQTWISSIDEWVV